MYKEHAYLLLKLGNEEEGIRVLVEKSQKIFEIIELTASFNINADYVWSIILKKA